MYMGDRAKIELNEQEILDRFKKIAQIRQRSLKLIVDIDKRVSEIKLRKLESKIRGIKDGS